MRRLNYCRRRASPGRREVSDLRGSHYHVTWTVTAVEATVTRAGTLVASKNPLTLAEQILMIDFVLGQPPREYSDTDQDVQELSDVLRDLSDAESQTRWDAAKYRNANGVAITFESPVPRSKRGAWSA